MARFTTPRKLNRNQWTHFKTENKKNTFNVEGEKNHARIKMNKYQ